MPWDRKRLLGYVEIIQLILGVTDRTHYGALCTVICDKNFWIFVRNEFWVKYFGSFTLIFK